MSTFKPKQKVVVKYGKEMRAGIIQSLLKSGKFKIKYDDGSIDTVSPNLIVDFEAYQKTIESNKPKKTKENIKNTVIDDDLDNDLEEVDWIDYDEEDNEEKEESEYEEVEEPEEELDWDSLEEEENEDNDDINVEDDEYDDLDIVNNEKSDDNISEIGDNWFGIGDEDDEKFANLPSSNIRFWLQKGTTTKITIITPKPVTYREHRVKIEGKYNFLTCLATTGVRCPLCEIGNRATPKKAFYIIDHTEYFSKKKNKNVKNTLRIWVLGSKQYELLKTVTEKYFKGEKNYTYRGLRVEVTRSNDKMAYNSGDYFFIEGVVKKDIFKGDFDKSINDLVNTLKPLDPKLLRSKLSLIETDDFDY